MMEYITKLLAKRHKNWNGEMLHTLSGSLWQLTKSVHCEAHSIEQ